MCLYLQYICNQILLSLTLQWEVSHELHYGWTTKKHSQHWNRRIL